MPGTLSPQISWTALEVSAGYSVSSDKLDRTGGQCQVLFHQIIRLQEVWTSFSVSSQISWTALLSLQISLIASKICAVYFVCLDNMTVLVTAGNPLLFQINWTVLEVSASYSFSSE